MTAFASGFIDAPRLSALFRATIVIALGTLALAAGAQQLYRSVGPDGRVTYTDQPPPPAPRGAGGTAARGDGTGSSRGDGGRAVAPSGGDVGAGLPYELRQTVGRYPVTLYTGTSCDACGGARAYLRGRGVPFVEKTIATNEDIDALQRAVGQNALPSATIGQQTLRGFAQSEWSSYLDAAGYPASSQLPTSYRYPSAAPLTTPKPVAAAAAESRSAPQPVDAASPPAPRTSGPGTPNPAGIKF